MKFLLTTNPLLGHLLPMLPLARAARDAGHEVVIASGPDLGPEIERRGFTAWSVGPDLATTQEGVRTRPRGETESAYEQLVGQGLAMFAAPGAARARDLVTHSRDWSPDVVVREIYELGGAYVAPRRGLSVVHGLGAHYPGFLPLASLALAEVARVAGPAAVNTPLAAMPYLDPFPAALQPPDDAPFSDVMPIRPEVGEVLPGEELPAAYEKLPYERTVYLTLGTVFNSPEMFAAPLTALSQLEVNVFATGGAGMDPAALGPLPDSVLLAGYVSQALILPHCAAVVSHAGAGTAIGALAAGLPQVCLPRGADQYVNAEQITRTGAGLTLGPGEADPDALRDAVARVLDDPSYAAAARGLQGELAQMPAPEEVLDELVTRADSLAAVR